jgi:hypothetical protein
VLVSIFSSLGLALVSGFGGLLTWYIPIYAAAGATYGQWSPFPTYSNRADWIRSRHYRADDLPLDVHGRRESDLHATRSCNRKTPCLPFVAVTSRRVFRLGCKCQTLQRASGRQNAPRVCRGSERSTGPNDDPGKNIKAA